MHTVPDIHTGASDELNDLTGELRHMCIQSTVTSSNTWIHTCIHDNSAFAVAGSFSVEVVGDGKKNSLGAIPVLLKDSDGKCLNRILLAKGLVKLLRGTDTNLPFYEEWKAAEKSARKHRRGMWFYGDVGESDDDGVDAD